MIVEHFLSPQRNKVNKEAQRKLGKEISEEINPMQFVYRIYSGVAMLTDLPEEISFVKFNLSLNKQL